MEPLLNFNELQQTFPKSSEYHGTEPCRRRRYKEDSQGIQGGKDSARFSKVIEVEKIKENEYNLSLTLYIFPGEEVGRLMQLRIGKTCHRLKREF